MGNGIDIGALSKTIAETLSQYSEEVADATKEAVSETMKELVADTKADAPKRSGRYRKAISSKIRYEDRFERRETWYVKKPFQGLAHLLEKGHALRNGGRAKAFPHIEKNRVKAESRFVERVKEGIKNAGK